MKKGSKHKYRAKFSNEGFLCIRSSSYLHICEFYLVSSDLNLFGLPAYNSFYICIII